MTLAPINDGDPLSDPTLQSYLYFGRKTSRCDELFQAARRYYLTGVVPESWVTPGEAEYTALFGTDLGTDPAETRLGVYGLLSSEWVSRPSELYGYADADAATQNFLHSWRLWKKIQQSVREGRLLAGRTPVRIGATESNALPSDTTTTVVCLSSAVAGGVCSAHVAKGHGLIPNYGLGPRGSAEYQSRAISTSGGVLNVGKGPAQGPADRCVPILDIVEASDHDVVTFALSGPDTAENGAISIHWWAMIQPTATGLGQATRPQWLQYCPVGATDADRLAMLGDPKTEAAYILSFIKMRHGSPSTALATYRSRGFF